MSRSTLILENPAVRTYKFRGEKFDKKLKKVTREAGFYHWDKNQKNEETGEDGVEVYNELPLTFLWLESAQSFTGYDSKNEKGFYSNEILNNPDAVKKYGQKKLDLKTDGKTVLSGYYKDIKEEAKGMGAKFCIPLYAAQEIDGEYQVVRFLMTGASGTSWMNFSDKNKNNTFAIVACDTNDVEMKTGDSYKEPVFKYIKATKEQIEIADELVKKVDDFFEYILSDDSSNKVKESSNTELDENGDDLPF